MPERKTLVTDSPEVAGKMLRNGRLVAFPTETVYGLGADATNAAAVKRLFDVKGRPLDNPLIVHLADVAQIDRMIDRVSGCARKLIRHFMPGPLTIVGTSTGRVAPQVTAGLTTIGVRVPDHETARAFLRESKTPVAAPSANPSGTPSATSWRAVLAALNGKIDCILRGQRSPLGLESTVVDCSTEPPALLRSGFITFEELSAICPTMLMGGVHERQLRSPGTRHRHYAPKADVVAVGSAEDARAGKRVAYIGLNPPTDSESFDKVLVCSDVRIYAYELYAFFHDCDDAGIRTVYCELPEESGIGRALADRIRRASDGGAG